MEKLYELVSCAKNDPKQMEILLRKFQPLISSLARRLKYVEYEDACQELALHLICLVKKLNIGNFQNSGDGALVSYIHKSLFSRCLNECRHPPVLQTDLGENVNLTVDHSPSPEDRAEFQSIFHILPPEQQDILTLYYRFGYTETEIALGKRTTQQFIHRTKKRALSQLQELYRS